jgi:hypothetical protein
LTHRPCTLRALHQAMVQLPCTHGPAPRLGAHTRAHHVAWCVCAHMCNVRCLRYITCSQHMILTPGLLCRQMLHEFGGPQLRFVVFSRTETEVRVAWPLPDGARRRITLTASGVAAQSLAGIEGVAVADEVVCGGRPYALPPTFACHARKPHSPICRLGPLPSCRAHRAFLLVLGRCTFSEICTLMLHCTVGSRGPPWWPTLPPLPRPVPRSRRAHGPQWGASPPSSWPLARCGPCTTPLWLVHRQEQVPRTPCTPCGWLQVCMGVGAPVVSVSCFSPVYSLCATTTRPAIHPPPPPPPPHTHALL